MSPHCSTLFRPPSRGVPRDRGSAMLMAIFVMALLTSTGAALLFLTSHEARMTRADLAAKQAFYLAEAGLEDARASLFAINGKEPFTDDLELVAGPNLLIDFLPQNLQPTFDGDGELTGFTGFGDDAVMRGPIKVADRGWYAAFMTNDAQEVRNTTIDVNNRVILAGVGVVPGGATEVVEAVIRKRNLFPSRPPATITLLGPAPVFEGASSNVKDYSGDDCNGLGGIPGLYMPVVGTVGASAEQSAEDGLTSNPDYISGAFTDEDVFADITDLGEPTVSSLPEPGWTDCQTLWDMVEDARELADNQCSGNLFCDNTTPCGVCDPRNTAAGGVTFIDGNYRVQGNLSGQGLLVVTGLVEFGGTVSWDGLVLVVGEGEFSVNGAGNGEISGGIFVADIAGADGSYGASCSISGGRCFRDADCPAGESCVDGNDNCTGGDNGFGNAVYDERGGGNAGTVFCSTHLDNSNPPRPYDILSFRQD